MSAGKLKKRGNSTTVGAKAFVCVVCAVIVSLVVLSSYTERETELEQSIASLSNMTMALSQHAGQIIADADIVLLGLLEHVKDDGFSKSSLKRMDRMMGMRVRELPALGGIFVCDTTGRTVASSLEILDAGDVAPGSLAYHKAHKENVAYVGHPVQRKSTGRWVVTISRRIDGKDGEFRGVALATIELEYFRRFYSHFNIGSNGSIMLAKLDGTVLMRRPLLEDSIGKKLGGTPLFENYIRREHVGFTQAKSNQDGVVRVLSFRRVADYPLFIVAAESEAEILSAWWVHAQYRLIGVVILLLLIGYGGHRLVIQIKLREEAEHEAIAARKRTEELNQVLSQQALRDGLTGLANRRKFDEVMKCEISQVARNRKPLTLIMFDIDHFKKFNDLYGHAAGDNCLRIVAKALQGVGRRDADVACRYGGEEFALVLPDCDEAGALMMAEKARADICALAIRNQASSLGVVTASVGVVTLAWPAPSATTPDELICEADRALYLSKNTGRNKVSIGKIERTEWAF